MNTYILERKIEMTQTVTVEGDTEQEAFDNADNENFLDDYKEETDWDTWEVIEVEYGKQTYLAKLDVLIDATSLEIAEQLIGDAAASIDGRRDSVDDQEAEVTEVTVTTVGLY